MSGHLGADLAALVDGELDHAARERVLRHLSGCAACRTEVDAQRMFKARLRALGAPDADGDLSARLRAVSAAGDPCSAAAARATTTRRRRMPAALSRRRSSRGPRSRSAVRRTALGGAALAIGLGAVFVLGAPHSPPTRTPVDPTSDVFLIDYAGVAGELPLPEPAGAGGPSR